MEKICSKGGDGVRNYLNLPYLSNQTFAEGALFLWCFI